MKTLKLRMPRYINLTTMDAREAFLLEKMDVLIKAVNRNKSPISDIIVLYEALAVDSFGNKYYETLNERKISSTRNKYKILEGVCTTFVPILTPDIKLLLEFSKSKLN